jgi:hypothetical protein
MFQSWLARYVLCYGWQLPCMLGSTPRLPWLRAACRPCSPRSSMTWRTPTAYSAQTPCSWQPTARAAASSILTLSPQQAGRGGGARAMNRMAVAAAVVRELPGKRRPRRAQPGQQLHAPQTALPCRGGERRRRPALQEAGNSMSQDSSSNNSNSSSSRKTMCSRCRNSSSRSSSSSSRGRSPPAAALASCR